MKRLLVDLVLLVAMVIRWGPRMREDGKKRRRGEERSSEDRIKRRRVSRAELAGPSDLGELQVATRRQKQGRGDALHPFFLRQY